MKTHLTAQERQVLGGLLLSPDARLREKTVPAIAARIGLSEHDVARTLAQLEDLHPPLVHGDTDASLGIGFWIALEYAIAALEGAEELSS